MATDVPVYTPQLWVPDAAPGISAAILQALENQVKSISDEFNLHNGGFLLSDHPIATSSARGFMNSTHFNQLAKLTVAVHETEQPPEIGATSSAGTDADVSRGDHAHRMRDARLSAVTGGFLATSAGPTLNDSDTGPVVGSTLAVSRPSGWTTTLVIVNAGVQYAAGVAGVQLNGNVVIDGVSGVTVQSGAAAADRGVTNIQLAFSRLTSDATINIGLGLWRTSGTGTGTNKFINYTYHLIRAA